MKKVFLPLMLITLFACSKQSLNDDVEISESANG
jgi:hypothetical protein